MLIFLMTNHFLLLSYKSIQILRKIARQLVLIELVLSKKTLQTGKTGRIMQPIRQLKILFQSCLKINRTWKSHIPVVSQMIVILMNVLRTMQKPLKNLRMLSNQTTSLIQVFMMLESRGIVTVHAPRSLTNGEIFLVWLDWATVISVKKEILWNVKALWIIWRQLEKIPKLFSIVWYINTWKICGMILMVICISSWTMIKKC